MKSVYVSHTVRIVRLLTLDVGVGAGDDDVELLAHLSEIEGHGGQDSAGPEIALDLGGGRGVQAAWAGLEDGETLVEDGEGVAVSLVATGVGAWWQSA
jgi:hypothetical protein